MKNLTLKKIQQMKPYSPPLNGRRLFDGMLLDFNERTIPMSKKIQAAIQQWLATQTVQIYPEYGDLEKRLALYTGMKTNQILLTNGSDQAIDLIFRTFTDQNDSVIIPTPSFAMFEQSAQLVGNKILRPAYNKENLSFPLQEVLDMVTASTKLIVICNPNNPTGTIVPLRDIEQIAKKARNSILLIDEAYFEFSNLTAVSLIKKYPNIIVTRTFSKTFGLAALRIGYLIASEKYLNELLKVRGPYDVNMISYIAACTALDELKEVQRYSNEIMNKAKLMVETFFTANNIRFYQSSANFLLYKPTVKNEEELLKKQGFLVRPQQKKNIENTLRLTIGTSEQMKQFIAVYQKVILNKKQKYAFLDRDGTLIFEPQDTYQIDSIKKLKLLGGVIEGLQKLQKQGYELVMVSNQDGLGTNSFPKIDFEKPQNKLLNILKKEGITFSNILICPHLPSEDCACRKPRIALVTQNIGLESIDRSYSFVCGDRETDRRFAKNLGIKAISMETNGDFSDALNKGGVII